MSEPTTDVPTEDTLVSPAACALCGDKSDVQIRKLDMQMFKVGCMTCRVFAVFPGNKIVALRMWNDHQAKINLAFQRALQHGANQVINVLDQMERDKKMFGIVLTDAQRSELNSLLGPLRPHF